MPGSLLLHSDVVALVSCLYRKKGWISFCLKITLYFGPPMKLPKFRSLQTPAEQKAGRTSHKTVVEEGRKKRREHQQLHSQGGLQSLRNRPPQNTVLETKVITQLNHWNRSWDAHQSAFHFNSSRKHFVYSQPARSAPSPGMFALHLIYTAPLSWPQDLDTTLSLGRDPGMWQRALGKWDPMIHWVDDPQVRENHPCLCKQAKQ